MLFALILNAEIDTITVSGDSNKNYSANLTTQETSPGLSNPVLNGLMGDKISLTLDGVKFNNALFRPGPNQYYSWVPNSFIKSITVDESIQESSLGGTLNRNLGINQNIVELEKSYNASKVYLGIVDKDLEIGLLSIDNQNIIETTGEVSWSSYNQNSLFLKNVIDKHKLIFIYTESKDVPRVDKFQKDQYYKWPLQQYFNLKDTFFIKKIRIAFGWQRFFEEIDQNKNQIYNPNINIKNTNDLFHIYLSRKIYHIVDTHDNIIFGIKENLENISVDTTTDVVKNNNYMYNTNYAWLKYHNNYNQFIDYSVEYNIGLLNTSGGVDFKRTLTGNSFGFKGNYIYNKMLFFGSVYSNFKFPTIVNLVEARNDSQFEIANPSLDTEKSITYSVGFKTHTISASIFYKNIRDMIIRHHTGLYTDNGDPITIYENADRGYIKGLHVEGNYDLTRDINMNMYIEYINGKTTDDYISKLQPFTLKTNINFYDFTAEFLYAPPVPDNKMNDNDMDDIRIKNHNYGYRIFNIHYNTIYNKVNIIFGVDNVFNDKGRVYGSGVDFNERQLKLKLKYKF